MHPEGNISGYTLISDIGNKSTANPTCTIVYRVIWGIPHLVEDQTSQFQYEIDFCTKLRSWESFLEHAIRVLSSNNPYPSF